jgi:hypothetical protein
MEVLEVISDYELERGKPIPTLNHGIIQSNLTIGLGVKYKSLYRVAGEVVLDTQQYHTRPDFGS